MKKRPDLTRQQVLAIKRELVAGTHPRALALAYNRNIETINRIRRGDSHNSPEMRVEGEEALRDPVVVITPQEAVDRGLARPVAPVHEEALAILGFAPDGTPLGAERRLPEAPAEVFDLAAQLLGKEPTVAKRGAPTPPPAYPTESGDDPKGERE